MKATARLQVMAVGMALTIVLAACGSNNNENSTSVTPRTPAATREASGPSATVSPRSGPPGTEITVSGNGWPAAARVEVVARTGGSMPYAAVAAAGDGSFTAKFRLEKQPDGSDLRVGPFDLIARSGTTEVPFAFQVETRRPIEAPGPGG
jgi:hypothetical protein